METKRLNLARRRQTWLYAALLLFGARLAWAFVDIQIVSHDAYLEDAQRQQKKRVEIPPTRGNIEDRNGVPLAVNREQYAIYLVPRHISDVEARAVPIHGAYFLCHADSGQRSLRPGRKGLQRLGQPA